MTRQLPKLLVLLLIVGVLGAVPLLLLALGGGAVTQPIECLTVDDGETFGGGRLDADQLQVAKEAVAAVRAFEPTAETPQASVIVLATGYQESGLRNLDHGDRDSLGFLQQRPSQGWGTAAQVRDVNHATTTFLLALIDVPDWRTRPVTKVAADVQRPDPRFADRYQQWVPLATALTERLWATSLNPTDALSPLPDPDPSLDPGRTSEMVTMAHANLYVGEIPAQFAIDLGQVIAGQPDFVTLNEVYNRTRAALQPDGYLAWHPEGLRDARDTAVLWRSDAWTLLDRGSRLMHTRHVRWGTRYVAWVTLRHQADGRVLSVIAGHASPAGPGRGGLFEEFRSNLIALITRLHARGPVLFGGDLNVQYPHLQPAATNDFEQPFAAAGAHTSYAVLGEPEGGWATGTHHGATIDYLISTSDAPPLAHATSTLSFSDHRMITAQIQLDPTITPDDWPDHWPEDWPSDGKGCDPVVLTGATGEVAYPVPAHLAWTNKDNWGSHGSHWASWHTGTDFAVACGTPVLAAHVGIVEIDTSQPWAGHQLLKVTRGPDQLTTWYAHLERVLATPGQVVQPGDQIGEAGDEGNATGCHLHFEVHLRNGPIYGPDNTDPTSWLADHIHPETRQPLG